MTGLPWWLSGKESACQCRRHTFDPWSRRIPPAVEQQSHNSRACALEPRNNTKPTCCNYWNPHTLEPCSATREATAVRSLCTATKSGSCSPQLEKSPRSSRDPAQPEINKSIKKWLEWESTLDLIQDSSYCNAISILTPGIVAQICFLD